MYSSILKRGSFNKVFCAEATGVYIKDSNGREYIDSCSGAVASLGYSNQSITDAMVEQVQRVPFAHTGTFTSEAAESLADLLIKQSNGVFSKVVFSPSGTEAVEVALKLASQFWRINGYEKKNIVLCRELSYHGGSSKTLEVGGQLNRKKYFSKGSNQSENIRVCNVYRNLDSFETVDDYINYCVDSLEREIVNAGAENVSCFLIETVGGSTSGSVTAPKGYFDQIEQLCKKYNILLILDEVMCGLGRTGYYYAYEAECISPDIIAVGKTIAAGYQPLAATLCNNRVADTIESLRSGFVHAGTYVGHNVACAAGFAAQKYVLENSLVDAVNEKGYYLSSVLKRELGNLSIVGDVRGRGFLKSIELVKSKAQNTPFSADENVSEMVKNIGMNNQILLYTCEGFSHKGTSDHILIAPPYICSTDELDCITERVVNTITTVESLLHNTKKRRLSCQPIN
ncbi:aminotransferase family protein [Saccharospirillum salsuginis]|uniref:Aspartate aminotransferase family protein n=1 Tax=Saccharospirillum salsuginis TaxID=418750 RepID=A0A918NCH9_9GAMM|nr:aminotransferase class III-fold pyridoxal phosphate-dependent enzyme [Saccharospirillum salsuginis]GGX57581.1 aspartate aminotransferase family protein [Saccharospirillum salsuginis]